MRFKRNITDIYSICIALEAARKAYNDVNNEIQSLERNLQTINDDLGKDYGEKHEWLKLKDTCVEKNEGE